MKKYYLAVLADILLVITFAALGATSHYGSVTAAVLARIAWPFLVALLLAHLFLRTWRAAPWQVWPRGVFIVLITVVGAMAIRSLIGDGTETAFVIVSFAVNTAFLLGWRVVTSLLARKKEKAGEQ